ncbi:DMT family transporter [uncultured Parasutterella sp.]|uniref:DMT family transporter n=1 Tax=uncultured Parasutterella sp. TaxID=1263098 RepID=UPI0025CECBE0|nr:DMT family transporter [uncultured Parasutterella sp.]
MKNNAVLGPFLLLSACLLFSTNGMWLAIAPHGATPYTVAGFRMIIAAVCLFMWCRVRRINISLRNWPWLNLLTFAFCIWLFQILFFNSVLLVGVALASVISIGSTPLFAGLLEWIFKKKSPPSAWYSATALAIFGVVLINSIQSVHVNFVHLFLPLGAGLVTAIDLMVAQKITEKHSAEEAMTLVMTICALLFLPFLFTQPIEWAFTSRGMLCVLMLGIVNASVAFSLKLAGLKTTPPAMAATLALAEPMGASVIGICFLGEDSSISTVIGILCILSSILILIFFRKPKETKEEDKLAPQA